MCLYKRPHEDLEGQMGTRHMEGRIDCHGKTEAKVGVYNHQEKLIRTISNN